jgi:hypothetical protein
MKDTLAPLRKLLTAGYLKEAAEWIKEGPAPFFNENELRAALSMLAAAILKDKPRPGKFHGQNKLPRTPLDPARVVSQTEWERQIVHAVSVRVEPNGRVKRGTYDDVAERFATGRDNVKRIWNNRKTR